MSGPSRAKGVLRSLAKAPSFSVGVVLTLTLGIGVTAAASSLVDGVLLAPLPHDRGSELVYLRQSAPAAGVENALFSVPEIREYRAGVDAFSGVAEFSSMRFAALDLDRPRELGVGIVTGNYFEVLGLGAQVGRVLGPGDDGEAAAPVAVLTTDFWEQVFGRDPSVVGRTMRMNGRTVTIVGVAESHPPYPERTDAYVNLVVSPHHLSATMAHDWTHRMTEVFARLQPGASLEGALAEVEGVASRLRRVHPEAYDVSFGYEVSGRTLKDQLTHRARSVLWMFMGTAVFVLLVSLANVANLTLARSSRLADELAVRAALGAGARTLRARLLAENLVLGLAGSVLGAALAGATLPLLAAYGSRFSVRAAAVGLETSAVVLAVVLGVAASVALAFAPALPNASSLGDLSKLGRSGRGLRGTQRVLVTVQVAASLMLVSGAGLLARSFVALQSIESGMEATSVLAMRLPPLRNGRTEAEMRDDALAVVDAAVALPDVRSAALTNRVPFSDDGALLSWKFDVLVDGAEAEAGAAPFRADFRAVSSDYFRTLGIDLRAGRPLERGDGPDAPLVAVVNEAFVRSYMDSREAVGHEVSWTGDVVAFAGVSGDPRRIVGVVADVVEGDLRAGAAPAVYMPHAQEPWGRALLVTASGDLESAAARVAEAVRGVVPEQPVEDVVTLEGARRASFGDARMNAQLVGFLAGVAVVIAALGVFAVLAFSVGRRTRELGVRMALGAEPGRVVRAVVAEGLAMVLVGVGLGIAGALVLGRFLRAMLYGVAPDDPLTLAAGAALLLAVSVAASVIPARRAARVDPARALVSD